MFGSMHDGALGEARARRDDREPDGGWGYIACCGQPAHFDCLARWLTPDDAINGSLVESTRGPVGFNLKCPFCRSTLSRSSTRMLVAGSDA